MRTDHKLILDAEAQCDLNTVLLLLKASSKHAEIHADWSGADHAVMILRTPSS